MLRVLVAEDSATARLLIVSLLSSDAELTVVGQAKNGAEAVALCESLRPDVVTMDIQMPVMDGLEATRQIVSRWGTPVIMVSSLDPADVSRSMLAFNAGALAVLAKPSGPGTPRFERDCRELIATVKALAEAKASIAEEQVTPAGSGAEVQPAPIATSRPGAVAIIGIVASTGGPIALRIFFKELPAKCNTPIVIVQQIAPGFASAFAEWLTTVSHRKVKVAVDRERVSEGVVYVAPDDRHLTVVGGAIELVAGEPRDGARPSGTVLLASLAKSYGARAAGVLLSGNGSDGVVGLKELLDAGGTSYVQDEASCTTRETSRAALEAGAVGMTTPLAEIPKRLANLIAGRPETHV
ncbi:MAG: response regulator [Deltaproteobacteria bacterium]|nr:response regulator [Deltaproteobacteria bacterium]MDQ3299603.1 response regulator [Myxococcota bacterium]